MSTLTLGHSLDPEHKETLVVGSVMQPVPLGVPLSAPLSPVKGMVVVVPASVLEEGITQPESANELAASQAPKHTRRATESRRVLLMATPPSTRTRECDKFFGDTPRRPYGATGFPVKGRRRMMDSYTRHRVPCGREPNPNGARSCQGAGLCDRSAVAAGECARRRCHLCAGGER